MVITGRAHNNKPKSSYDHNYLSFSGACGVAMYLSSHFVKTIVMATMAITQCGDFKAMYTTQDARCGHPL